MPLMEQVYSVLLVSASQAVNDAFHELLPAGGFSPIHVVSDTGAARRAFTDRPFDIVVINSPLPDDPGVRFAIDACSGKGTVVLLLIRAELFDEITDRVCSHGVFTLQKPSSRTMLQTSLRWLVSARERLRKTETKTQTLEEKMAEIRLVNRAKWLLIERKGMDEPTAHRFIEKQAMDRCITRRAIAEEIINEFA